MYTEVMRVYMAFINNGDVVGFYSTRQWAEHAVAAACPIKDFEHKHLNQRDCGVTSIAVDRTFWWCGRSDHGSVMKVLFK